MNDFQLHRPEDMRAFLKGTCKIKLKTISSQEASKWIYNTLSKSRYDQLSKQDKGTVKAYLEKVIGFSRSHIARSIRGYSFPDTLKIPTGNKNKFPRRYTREDVMLLVQTDQAHKTLSGPATKKLFERAFKVHQDPVYERLAGISVSHLYNLRNSVFYKRQKHSYDKTKPTPVQIGHRRKPQSDGKPGYLRIDTVHQGDLNKVKGVYYINAVDEVTQYEVVCSVEKISENYLIPVLETMLATLPFEIKGFHSDNGSEYVNKNVAKLLDKLHVEFTKSRSRHSNGNALVESKNGSVIRQHMGYLHIPQKCAPQINAFLKTHMNPYLNFHRPCHFAETHLESKGKVRKTYPYKNIKTPYEKLKSLPDAQSYLKPGITFEELDRQAHEMSDLTAAKEMANAKKQLFNIILAA